MRKSMWTEAQPKCAGSIGNPALAYVSRKWLADLPTETAVMDTMGTGSSSFHVRVLISRAHSIASIVCEYH